MKLTEKQLKCMLAGDDNPMLVNKEELKKQCQSCYVDVVDCFFDKGKGFIHDVLSGKILIKRNCTNFREGD